ncbi:hypothetical protein ACFLSZ_02745 [Candidatus Bipolaricaulota bacterium]
MIDVLEFVRSDRLKPKWNDDTAAINRAIKKAADTKDNEVLFPSLGKFLDLPLDPREYSIVLPGPAHYLIDTAISGAKAKELTPIRLMSEVRLVFEEGAVLRALPSEEHKNAYAVILGENVSNAEIVGPGEIVGEWDSHILKDVDILRAKVVLDSRGRLSGLDILQGEPQESNVVVLSAEPDGGDLHTRLRHPEKKAPATGREWVLKAILPDTLSGKEVEVVLLPGEFGMGVMLCGVRDVTLSDFTVRKCWGDGIYIRGIRDTDPSPENQSRGIVIKDVKALRNRRANLAITDARDFKVIGGEYCEAGYPAAVSTGQHATVEHVVDHGIIGARCGIQIEPDEPGKPAVNYRAVYNGEITGVTANYNVYDGIHIAYRGSWGIEVHGNTCLGNGSHPPAREEVTMPGITFAGAQLGRKTEHLIAPHLRRLPGVPDGHGNFQEICDSYGGETAASGIHVCRARGINLRHNLCAWNNIGIRVTGVAAASSNKWYLDAYGVCVTHNHCMVNCKQGLSVEGSVRGAVFHANSFSHNGLEGIRVAATTDDGFHQVSKPCPWATSECVFRHNACVGNGWKDPGKACNMILTGHCYWNVIQKNDFRKPTCGETYSQHALHIASDNCYKTLVSENQFEGGAMGSNKEYRDEGDKTVFTP